MGGFLKRIGLIFAALAFLTGCGEAVETGPEMVYATFKDYDNALLFRQKIPAGARAVYEGAEPMRDMTAAEVFTFSGWDKEIGQPIYEDTVFKALYNAEPRAYIVTFLDYDGTLLQRRNLNYGTYATYGNIKPSRKSDDDRIDYEFIGWDKDPSETKIVGDTVFTAQYRVLEYVYATFVNYDGEVLETAKIEKGSFATYSGSTPTKKSNDERVEYVFDGWNKDIDSYPVETDTTFVAQFKTQRYFFATFVNYDGTLLRRAKTKEGEIPVYSGYLPTRSSGNSNQIYEFVGWEPSLNFSIQQDTTYTAKFDLLNIYTVRFENYDGTLLQSTRVKHGDSASYTGSTPHRPDSQSGGTITTYTFTGWSISLSRITSNCTAVAQYSSSTKRTGPDAVRDYLDNHGSGSYHNVTTSRSQGISTLGYLGSYFYMGNSNDQDGVESYMGISCTFGASSGSASFNIYASGVLTFAAKYSVLFSGHRFSNISVTSIDVNLYTTNEQISAAAALTVLSAKAAVNNAAAFLEDQGLPYVF